MAGSGTFRAIPPYLFGQPAQPGTHCAALSGMEREQRRRRKREWWKDEIADLPDWHAAAADLPAPKRVTHAASERCLASPALIRDECERVRAEAQKAGRRFKPIDSPN